MAISDWYKRRYDCDLDPMTQCVATMGSKEGYAHLTYAITNPGDVAVVPDPTYPIHSQAFILAGANVEKMKLVFDENTFKVDENNDMYASGLIKVKIANKAHLNQIIGILKSIEGVREIRRVQGNVD